VTRAGRVTRLLTHAGLASGLVALTLVPADDVLRRLGLATCLACGDFETLDVVHNFLLFLPVGAVLTRWLRSPGLAILVAAAASLSVEVMQLALPARDPSWVDLLTNTTGAAVGATVYRLWRQRATWRASQLVLAWAGAGALWLGATGASGVLLQPAAVPPQDLFGQWAPRRASFAEFRGRVVSFDAGAVEMPHGPVPDPVALRAALGAGEPIRLVITRLPAEGVRPALLARLVARNHEVVAFTERQGTFQVRVRLRASDRGLRSPFVVVSDPARQGGGVMIESVVRGDSVRLQVEAEGRTAVRRLPLEVGLGWATIAPVEVELGAWSRGISALWLALLAFPLGICVGRTGDGRSFIAAAIAIGLLAAGLAGVPFVAGLAPSHASAWLGALAAVMVGRAVGLRAGRARGESRTEPVRPSL
jgi:hypothetical protein